MDLANILTKLVLCLASIEHLDISMRSRLVNCHVEDARVELAEVEESIVNVVGANDRFDQAGGQSRCTLRSAVFVTCLPSFRVIESGKDQCLLRDLI